MGLVTICSNEIWLNERLLTFHQACISSSPCPVSPAWRMTLALCRSLSRTCSPCASPRPSLRPAGTRANTQHDNFSRWQWKKQLVTLSYYLKGDISNLCISKLPSKLQTNLFKMHIRILHQNAANTVTDKWYMNNCFCNCFVDIGVILTITLNICKKVCFHIRLTKATHN